MTTRILVGDCVARMAELPPESVDTILCDPPYGLEFMGKDWDRWATPPAFQEWTRLWASAALRVAKPGAFLLAFGGTRTWHRLACGVEDAGWELRDTIGWIHSQGFPKSLDVSRQVDAGDALLLRRERALQFTAWMRSAGITAAQINAATNSCRGSHYLTDAEQPEIATEEMFSRLRPLLPPIPGAIEALVRSRTVESENLKRRPIIGQHADLAAGAMMRERFGGDEAGEPTAIATPYTADARRWQGYGTALKPAWEPILVAMKPLAGTFAENAIRHGVAGLNIDGARIPIAGGSPAAKMRASGPARSLRRNACDGRLVDRTSPERYAEERAGEAIGRWPPNVVLDEEAAAALDAQSGDGVPRVLQRRSERANYVFDNDPRPPGPAGTDFHDSGGASRFFYVAKAGSAERWGLRRCGCGRKVLDPPQLSALFAEREKARTGNRPLACPVCAADVEIEMHPTTKPLTLMQWLARLTKTPSGGLVLDPFLGSGTTALACQREGRDCIGIEQSPEYVALAAARIRADQPLFAQVTVEEATP